MKSKQSIYFSIGAGFILTTIAIVGIALILEPPESRSDQFWPRTLWAVFLGGLMWSAGASYLSLPARKDAQHREVGGVAPAALLVVVMYAVLSLLAMLLHAFVPESDALARLHLLFQVLLGMGGAVLLVFLNLARSHAGVGVQTDFRNVPSPSDLCDLLEAEERRIAALPAQDGWTECVRALKALRETLRYGLPQTTVLEDQPLYCQIATELSCTCQALHTCENPSSPGTAKCVSALNALQVDAKSLSSKSIRR